MIYFLPWAPKRIIWNPTLLVGSNNGGVFKPPGYLLWGSLFWAAHRAAFDLCPESLGAGQVRAGGWFILPRYSACLELGGLFLGAGHASFPG